MATGEKVRHFSGHRDTVTCIAVAPFGRILASGSDDHSILLWNLTNRSRAEPHSPQSDRDGRVEISFKELASRNASKAYDAYWMLTEEGETAVRLLRQKLKPVVGLTADAIVKLIKQLEDEDF